MIIDCTSHISADILSTVALENADSVIRLCSPDFKGISYFASQLPCLMGRRFNPERHIKILSNFKNGQAVSEIKEFYGGIDFELPYLSEIEEQYYTAGLLEGVTSKEGKKFEHTLKVIIKEAFNE